MQLGIEGVALHRECVQLADVLLQGDPLDPLVQLLKGDSVKFSQHQQHPLRRSQTQIRPCQQGQIPGKGDPSVRHL